MLVLSRKQFESVQIEHAGETIEVLVAEIQGGKIRLGFKGPKSFRVNRTEVPNYQRSAEHEAR